MKRSVTFPHHSCIPLLEGVAIPSPFCQSHVTCRNSRILLWHIQS